MRIQKIPVQNRTTWVVDQLTESILRGDMPRDEPLPPERQLAEQLGVSRNVLREATKILQSQGLVAVRQGVGTIVLGISSQPMQRVLTQALVGRADPLLKLLEVRLTLEVAIVELAAMRRNSNDLTSIEGLLDQFDKAAELQDLPNCARLDVEFHRALAESTHNEIFALMLDSVSGLMVENRQLALQNSTLQLAGQHHRAIFAAVKNGSSENAAQEMRRHLETSRRETEEWLKEQAAKS